VGHPKACGRTAPRNSGKSDGRPGSKNVTWTPGLRWGRGPTNSKLSQAEGNHLPRERVVFEKDLSRAACASLQGRAERRETYAPQTTATIQALTVRTRAWLRLDWFVSADADCLQNMTTRHQHQSLRQRR